jgi:hypothetical protein
MNLRFFILLDATVSDLSNEMPCSPLDIVLGRGGKAGRINGDTAGEDP